MHHVPKKCDFILSTKSKLGLTKHWRKNGKGWKKRGKNSALVKYGFCLSQFIRREKVRRGKRAKVHSFCSRFHAFLACAMLLTFQYSVPPSFSFLLLVFLCLSENLICDWLAAHDDDDETEVTSVSIHQVVHSQTDGRECNQVKWGKSMEKNEKKGEKRQTGTYTLALKWKCAKKSCAEIFNLMNPILILRAKTSKRWSGDSTCLLICTLLFSLALQFPL